MRRALASRTPADVQSSNRHAAMSRGVAMTQIRRLPSASHHARMVRTSRELGDRPPIGCVCMKPTTSPRDSSRASVQAPSATTLTAAPAQ
jgi:hypothetical protein